LIRPVHRKCSGRNRMDKLKAPGKPFDISKRAVWEAWEKVKANKGAPGVDAVTVAEFESDLKNNLYKIWNRLSSGTYFPPPVRAVEVPKPHGGAREFWACLLSGIGWRRRWWRG
jgi:RNA-directed DNA polymerase